MIYPWKTHVLKAPCIKGLVLSVALSRGWLDCEGFHCISGWFHWRRGLAGGRRSWVTPLKVCVLSQWCFPSLLTRFAGHSLGWRMGYQRKYVLPTSDCTDLGQVHCVCYNLHSFPYELGFSIVRCCSSSAPEKPAMPPHGSTLTFTSAIRRILRNERVCPFIVEHRELLTPVWWPHIVMAHRLSM